MELIFAKRFMHWTTRQYIFKMASVVDRIDGCRGTGKF